MITHIVVGTNDLERSRKFYDATFDALGLAAGILEDHRRYFYMLAPGLFVVSQPINGQPATFANGGTVGFGAASPEQADAWFAAGLANGGTACEDPPGTRNSGGNQVYAAYLRDPSENKLCVVFGMT